MSEETEEKLDIDHDGKISKVEVNIAEDKFKNRRRMAWLALYSMVVFTAILLSPLITDDRIKALDNVFGMFYIAMASVIGAYMGFTTWASKN
jgi:hypothetical protein